MINSQRESEKKRMDRLATSNSCLNQSLKKWPNNNNRLYLVPCWRVARMWSFLPVSSQRCLDLLCITTTLKHQTEIHQKLTIAKQANIEGSFLRMSAYHIGCYAIVVLGSIIHIESWSNNQVKFHLWNNHLSNDPNVHLFQIQEWLPYQEEGSDTLEPLLADVCLFCFNNMETFRSEVTI